MVEKDLSFKQILALPVLIIPKNGKRDRAGPQQLQLL
jgi:hypothetical protein